MIRVLLDKHFSGYAGDRRGFTIIELLIVIVIIGILATITIVAYNGIRDRAYKAQIVSGTQSFYQVIEMYHAVNGVYPTTTPEQNGDRIAMACLGVGYPGQSCGKVNSVTVYEDPLFNTQLNTVIGSTPRLVSDVSITVPGESYTGAVYGIDETTASPTGFARMIEYAVRGDNANCGITKAWAYSSAPGGTACEIDLEEVPAR